MNKRTQIFESLAVLATGIGKVVFINLYDYRLIFIITTCLFWAGYALFRLRSQKKKDQETRDKTSASFKTTFLELLPLVALIILSFLIYGLVTEKSVITWSIIPILFLYPIWGILQQYLVLELFGANLKQLLPAQTNNWLIILITACLFAIVHYPFPLLIVSTFFLAIVYMYLFLRGRSIIAMGIYHGWLAAFFFYYVLGRNPWLEAFGNG